MSTPNYTKKRRYIRLGVTAPIALGLAVAILWGLVSVKDPVAKLNKAHVSEIDDKLYLEIEVENPNYFRGFNHTPESYIKVFYLFNDDKIIDLPVGKNATPVVYQRPRKTLVWNFTLRYDIEIYGDPVDYASLKNQGGYVYVYMHLTYCYKFLLWITNTNYEQWLDVSAYLDDNLQLNKVVDFGRTKNFDPQYL